MLDVQARYSADDAGTLNNSMVYQGFFSIFPLVLLGFAILGFVLSGNPELQDRIVRSISRSIPGLNLPARGVQAVIRHRLLSTILAFFGLAWTGQNVVRASGHALARIFRRPEPAGLRSYGWAFSSMGVLGALFILSALAGAFLLRGSLIWLGALAVPSIDFAMFIVSYRILSFGPGPAFRYLWKGALFAAVGWSIVRVLGVWYVSRTIQHAHPIYGSFAAAVGLLVLLSLAAKLFSYGAELNALLMDRAGHTKQKRPVRKAAGAMARGSSAGR